MRYLLVQYHGQLVHQMGGEPLFDLVDFDWIQMMTIIYAALFIIELEEVQVLLLLVEAFISDSRRLSTSFCLFLSGDYSKVVVVGVAMINFRSSPPI